jgi:hypothetical protein
VADDEEVGKAFLERWSARKLRAREPVEPAAPAGPELRAPAADSEEAEEGSFPTDADMPPLESLGDRSDYSGFLSPGVSEALRRRALSKLFHSPRLNLVDGLDDYAEDFASFVPLGDIVTADMRHRMEQAAKRMLADAQDAGDAADTLAAEPADGGDWEEPATRRDDPGPDPDEAEQEA